MVSVWSYSFKFLQRGTRIPDGYQTFPCLPLMCLGSGSGMTQNLQGFQVRAPESILIKTQVPNIQRLPAHVIIQLHIIVFI